MTWSSTTAALRALARYRLDGRGLRSGSDFGGAGGTPSHEVGGRMTESFDRVADVERALLAAYRDRTTRPHTIRIVPDETCHAVLLTLVVGRRVETIVEAKLLRRDGETDARGYKLKPGRAAKLAIGTDVQVAERYGLAVEQTHDIVRHGMRQVGRELERRELVSPRRKEQAMATSKLARKIAPNPEFLSGWKQIAAYVGCSAKTARRKGRVEGLPFKRDDNGWPISTRSQIDEWKRRKHTGAAA